METALLQKKITSLILLCYEDERPFRGLIGELDWRFNGHFTRLVQDQTLSGKKDEVIYAPLQWNDETIHFLILGQGQGGDKRTSTPFSKTTFEKAMEKAYELRLQNIGISRFDWNLKEADLEKIQGRKLCILH